MKKQSHFLLSLVIASLVACQANNGSSTNHLGATMDTSGALTVDAALAVLDSVQGKECKISGKVLEVCQGEGCWLTLEKTDGGKLMVRTADQSFHFPKDITGKSVFIKGQMRVDTTERADLRQEDQEKIKPDSINVITPSPEISPVLVASGIIIR
jgi:hypothetical protein